MRSASLLVATIVACLAACSSSSPKCIDGQSAACSCTNGRTGAQVCLGGAYAACSCDPGTDMSAGLDMSSELDMSSYDDLESPSDLETGPDMTLICSGAGTIDSSQPLASGTITMKHGDVLGQTFLVGRSGRLDAISAVLCKETGVADGNVTISVYNGTQLLASTTVSSSTLTNCSTQTRFAIGCAAVTSGTTLQIQITNAMPTPACGGGICSGSVQPCNVAADCDVLNAVAQVGTTPECTLNGVADSEGAIEYSTFVE
jgi:hypothetical protein